MTPDDIVRALANVDPYRREMTHGGSYFVCVLCGGTDYERSAPAEGEKPKVEHADGCPWVASLGIVSHPPVANPTGGFYPAGVGWRIVDPNLIEVDGVGFVFEYLSRSEWVSREVIGEDRLRVARGTAGQEIADMIRERLAVNR